MWCPYCGYEMRQGYVRLRGQWGAWAGVLAVNFEAGDGSGEGSQLLPRTLFRSHERAAHCCVRCEAVLVEPKSGAYTPPAGESEDEAEDGTADAADTADAAEDATTTDELDEEVASNGNGHSPGT